MASTTTEQPGRVSRVDRGICDVLTLEGTVRASWSSAVARDAHHSPDAVPCVGDEVLLRHSGDQTWLEEVFPRRNAITRASVSPGSSQHQVLAANVDVLGICEPCHPAPAAGRVERLLALAWESGVQPAVILTKTDLAQDVPRTMAEMQLLALGAPVVAVSATTGVGIEDVCSLTAPGQALALLGPSGAGKSTLLNTLLGVDAMATSQVRADGKGRHVTARRELFALDNGSYVIDTPGLRSIGLATVEGLDQVFAEISSLAESCRFRDCEHRTEPGCAVLAAIDDGSLQPRRLDSYRKLLREAAYQQRRGNARLEAEERARWKSLLGEMRRSGRSRP
jgi:ribosome biogenesis GTPase